MNFDILTTFVYLIVLFTAFPIHECAHALTAHWLGDDTADNAGRLTLNPFRHLSLFGTILMLFLGFGFAKPVPVNPNNFKNPKWGMALTSLAGPVSNLILSYISIIACRVFSAIYAYSSSSSYDVYYYLTIAFQYMAIVNLGLAVFNLLPIPPLDGSKLFGAVLPQKIYFKIMRYENIIVVVLVILSITGLLSKPLNYIQNIALKILIFLSNWVDILMNFILGR